MNAALNEAQAMAGGDLVLSTDQADAEIATSRAKFAGEWGDVALAAQAAGELKPAWAAFLKRKFYVPILRSPDDNPKHYLLHFARDADGRRPTLVISEVRERLDLNAGDGLVALSGVDLLLRLDGQGAIDVALRSGVFHISRKRADWMRNGIEETRARVTIRKLLQAAAPGGPFPVLRVSSATHAVAPPAPSLAARAVSALAYVRDARYFVPVTLSVAAIGMMFVLGEANQSDQENAAPAQQFAAPAVTPAFAPAVVSAQASAQPFGSTVAPQVFTPWDHSFSVQLPGLAEEVEMPPDSEASPDGLPANFYRLEHDGVTYEMTVLQYANGVPPDLNAEMNFRQQIIAGGNGTVGAVRPLPMGASAREVQVRLGGGAVRTARFAIHGTKLCLLTVTLQPGAAGAASANAALASFQLH